MSLISNPPINIASQLDRVAKDETNGGAPNGFGSHAFMKTFIAVLFGVAIATSCGIDTNAAPFDLNTDELGMNDGIDAPLAAPDTGGTNSNTGYLYLTDDTQQLVLVDRQFRTPPTPQSILEALVQQPLANEIADIGFLTTDLPSTLAPQLVNTDSETGTVTVSVSDEADLRTLARTDTARTQRIFAQIVCSLDWYLIGDDTPISGVLIEDSQGPIIATDTQLASIIGPAATSDFNNCRSTPET